MAFALVLDKLTQFGALCSAALALVVFGLVRAGGGGTAAATASSFVVYNRFPLNCIQKGYTFSAT